MDIILFQRIGGGWEFLFTASESMIYQSFHLESTLAKTRLLRQLGWISDGLTVLNLIFGAFEYQKASLVGAF